jgi:hypothetical protein
MTNPALSTLKRIEPTRYTDDAAGLAGGALGRAHHRGVSTTCRLSVHRFELQAHSIELSPHGDAVVIGATEGHVKFRRQIKNISQQQPNASGREVSHRSPARPLRTTRSEIEVALRSSRTRTTVPSRIRQSALRQASGRSRRPSRSSPCAKPGSPQFCDRFLKILAAAPARSPPATANYAPPPAPGHCGNDLRHRRSGCQLRRMEAVWITASREQYCTELKS